MGPADEIDVVFLQELLDHGLTERVRHATIVFTPAGLALLRVGPDQIAEEPALGHLGWPRDLLQLRNGDELRAQTAVHTEDLVIDECSNGHAIEYVLEFFPHADGVATLAFVVESIDAIDLTALVISPQQEEILLEFDLVGEEKDYRLE